MSEKRFIRIVIHSEGDVCLDAYSVWPAGQKACLRCIFSVADWSER